MASTKQQADNGIDRMSQTAHDTIDRATQAASSAYERMSAKGEEFMAAGFADRVDKPVDADRLITAIRAALRTEQRAKAVTS